MTPLEDLLARHPLPDASDGSKDDKGHVLVVGGPPTCPGAVVLSATAALRVGAGRVQVAVDPSVAPAVGVQVPELGVFAWNQKASPPPEIVEHLRRADAALIGPGHRHLDDIVVRSTAERVAHGIVILDAGALACTFAVARGNRVVIAPNPTEAAQLLDHDGDEELLARALADKLDAAVAVRGARTVIAEGDDVYEFASSPAGLGTPGSGDVFTGVLAALVASGCAPVAALGWAVHLHAEAARRLAERTPVGYLASEVVRELPYVRANAGF